MPNINAPFGLRLLQRQNDSTPSFGLGMDPLRIAAANTTRIAKGDVLTRLSTGYVTAFTGAIGTTPASGKQQAVGIFWGCSYLSTAQGKRTPSPYWPGGDTTQDVDVQYIPLTGFPGARFVAQSNGAPFTFADIGQNVDIAYTAPTVYGSWAKSNVTLNQSTLGTSLELPFRIVGLWSQYQRGRDLPGTDNTSSFNWAVVEFNLPNQTGI